MDNLPRALEGLVSSGNLDEKVAEAILQIMSVEDALEVVWKNKHAEVVKKAQEEIVGLNTVADGIKRTIEELNKEIERLKAEKTGLENTLLELQRKGEEVKIEAQQVFEAELKRLAHSPASTALLGAWIGGGNKPADRSQPLIRIQCPDSELPQAADLNAALFNNLKACSLSPIVAMELTTVCRAALAAGQPISFRSLFADLLAEAVASALGQPATVWADVPVGLLDPVDWDGLISDDHRGCPIILQNANRSDVPLVLGALRPALLRHALGHRLRVVSCAPGGKP